MTLWQWEPKHLSELSVERGPKLELAPLQINPPPKHHFSSLSQSACWLLRARPCFPTSEAAGAPCCAAVALAWRSTAKHCLHEVEAVWCALLLHPQVAFDPPFRWCLLGCTSTCFLCRVVGTLCRHVFPLQHLGQLFGKIRHHYT